MQEENTMTLLDSLKFTMGCCAVPTPKIFLDKLKLCYHMANSSIKVINNNKWELSMKFNHRGKITEEKFLLTFNDSKAHYITKYEEI